MIRTQYDCAKPRFCSPASAYRLSGSGVHAPSSSGRRVPATFYLCPASSGVHPLQLPLPKSNLRPQFLIGEVRELHLAPAIIAVGVGARRRRGMRREGRRERADDLQLRRGGVGVHRLPIDDDPTSRRAGGAGTGEASVSPIERDGGRRVFRKGGVGLWEGRVGASERREETRRDVGAWWELGAQFFLSWEKSWRFDSIRFDRCSA